MKNSLYILVALALGLSLSAPPALAGRQQVILSGTLVIEGAGDSRDLLRAIARRFKQIHPNVSVEVPGDTGTHSGIRAVGESTIEMARVARPPKDNEKRYGLTYRAFAESPVVFAVPPDVRRIGDLSTEQVIKIYSGDITNWKYLGGMSRKIYPVGREVNECSRAVLDEKLPGFKDIKAPASKTFYTTSEAIEAISRHKSTIGYAPMAAVRKTGLKILKLDGVFPSARNVKNGTYKMTVPLGVVYKGKLRPPARAFVDFLYSREARRIIRDYGCIPVGGGK